MSSQPANVPPAVPAGHASTSSPPAPNHTRNPSYPHRMHFGEKTQLEQTLRAWDATIAARARTIASLPPKADRALHQKLHFQMLGARDQMAAAVRRLPLEVGALYEEDQELLHNAQAALERLTRQWDALTA